MLVKEGDKVSLGQPIFYDKNDEDVKIVSPVSGIVKEIVRGAKRKILNVIIQKEGEDILKFDIPSFSKLSSHNFKKVYFYMTIRICSPLFSPFRFAR